MKNPIPVFITDPEITRFFVDLVERDITKSFILDIFGEYNSKRKYNWWDVIEIPAQAYGNSIVRNKESFRTTIGCWIFNKLSIEQDLSHVLGYINKQIDGDLLDDINEKLSYKCLEGKISLDILKKYILKSQIYMRTVTCFSSNFTDEMLTISSKMGKMRDELFEQFRERFEKGDEVAAAEVESAILKYCKDILKDDESLDVYLSGARGSYGNNFKNLFVMKGAYLDNGKFTIIKSNYMEGIKKEDYADVANALVAGPYGRAKKTEVGGYQEKLFIAACQHVVTKHATDCGTKRTVSVKVNKAKDLASWMYSYILNNDGSLTEITSENISSFVGKTVNIRFSGLCEAEGYYCNKCCGNLFNRMGISNIGILTSTFSSKIKTTSMKSFHNSTIKITTLDLKRIFFEMN